MSRCRPFHRKAWALLVVGLAVSTLPGCVTKERHELAEARKAYDQCVRELSASQPECIALDEKRRMLQKQYEDRAQRAWGCDPNGDTCPPAR
jgi:uncharacterized protein involved in exopolysaccharide biosynthesis